jgi:transcriptional regulator with GAF, ATPase, and Fis domain
MLTKVLIKSVGSIAESFNERLHQALINTGVVLSDRDSIQPVDAGILLFDQVNSSIFDYILKHLNQTSGRLLCLGVMPEKLTVEETWSLMTAGAKDVWTCTDLSNQLLTQLTERFERWHRVDQLLDSQLVRSNLVGESPVWKSCLRQLIETARFTDANILITGESGVGKELAARLVHSLDKRKNKGELVILDCTTIVSELAGSEFFGHERGSFTGAIGHREGAFALANHGTLFLDEVGELPLSIQAQLLRIIQEKKYRRVGGNIWHKTDFRLVCATNRNLEEEVTIGQFRNDLYFRLAGCLIKLPSLKQRPQDILPLARHFLAERTPDDYTPEIHEPVKEFLQRRDYPGNVRELRQLISRIATRHVGKGPITVGDIPEMERPKFTNEPKPWMDNSFDTAIKRALCLGIKLKDIGQSATETAIRIAVNEENGNLQRAAKRLGVTDRTLQIRRAKSK